MGASMAESRDGERAMAHLVGLCPPALLLESQQLALVHHVLVPLFKLRPQPLQLPLVPSQQRLLLSGQTERRGRGTSSNRTSRQRQGAAALAHASPPSMYSTGDPVDLT